ncbi:hypothetical protein CYMTET_38746 [Cymbomonas tetramitiformis]|uniref:Uncharacterized protein n=1 Tax=Cymbomonas tetramitiformis TaxID=36881 RepID=A0AAE0F4Y5_9CHLO|nr:hypothetical protein CYMTET_38746 [Cymbomonas tetramitiformis]
MRQRQAERLGWVLSLQVWEDMRELSLMVTVGGEDLGTPSDLRCPFFACGHAEVVGRDEVTIGEPEVSSLVVSNAFLFATEGRNDFMGHLAYSPNHFPDVAVLDAQEPNQHALFDTGTARPMSDAHLGGDMMAPRMAAREAEESKVVLGRTTWERLYMEVNVGKEEEAHDDGDEGEDKEANTRQFHSVEGEVDPAALNPTASGGAGEAERTASRRSEIIENVWQEAENLQVGEGQGLGSDEASRLHGNIRRLISFRGRVPRLLAVPGPGQHVLFDVTTAWPMMDAHLGAAMMALGAAVRRVADAHLGAAMMTSRVAARKVGESKMATYGDVRPHQLIPFGVEAYVGLGPGAVASLKKRNRRIRTS